MFSVVSANTSFERVASVPVVRPRKAGPNWKAVSHGELLSCLMDTILARGMRIGNKRFHLSKLGTDVTAAIEVVPSKGVELPPTWTLWMAVNATHSGKRTARFYCGGEVEQSSGPPVPLVIHSAPAHRYDEHFDTVNVCDSAVAGWLLKVKTLGAEAAKLRSGTLTKPEVEELLFAAARRRLMPWSRIGRVDWLYRNQDGDNRWALLRAFARQLVLSPPDDQLDNGLGIFRLITAPCQAKPKKTLEVGT